MRDSLKRFMKRMARERKRQPLQIVRNLKVASRCTYGYDGRRIMSVVSKDNEVDRLFGWNLSPKCIKRQALDESSYAKPELADLSDTSARDPSNLKSLIQAALKIKPFVRRSVRKSRKTQLAGVQAVLKRHLENLTDIQRGIDRLDQELEKHVFLEGFRFLDQLRPLLTKRFCVVIGEFLPELGEGRATSIDQSLRESVRNGFAPSRFPTVVPRSKVWSGFWLDVLLQCMPTALMIFPWDRDILVHLIDVSCTSFIELPAFSLDFVFSTNPYFTNTTLSRHFEFRKVWANELAGNAEHYQPTSSSGCVIQWSINRNVTIWTKSTRCGSGIDSENMKNTICAKRSFFNFFTPLVTTTPMTTTKDIDNQATKTVQQIAFDLDFHVANVIRTSLIPKALDFYQGTTNKSTYSANSGSAVHPVRKAAALDTNRHWTEEELETREQFWYRKDGYDAMHPDQEVGEHVRRGLEWIGYRIQQGHAYHRGDITTSGESNSWSSPGEEGEADSGGSTRKTSFRGLLETNTVKQKRRHGGTKLTELHRVANESASEDDKASLLDLQSGSGDSCYSEINLLAGISGGKKIGNRRKTDTVVKRKTNN